MMRWMLLFLFIPLFGFSFKEKCLTSSKGDYIVYQQGHQLIYLSIYDITANTIVIEEIHSLDSNQHLKLNNVLDWVLQGGKGASQWILYEMLSETGAIIEAYAPTKRSFFNFDQDPPLLSRLFLTKWDEMPDSRRKIIPSTKKVWSPQKKIKNLPVHLEKSTLYRKFWEKDQSFLSELRIDLHFDPQQTDTFPYMIDIQNSVRPLARFYQVDQGKKSPGAAKYFPRRHPDIENGFQKKGNFLLASIDCSPAFYPFELYLQDVQSLISTPVSFESEKKSGRYHVKILLPQEDSYKGKTYRLSGKSLGPHRTKFDSIEVFEIN
ncbi:MAG: hypothetical protein EB053_02925 [Chlamydiae bacterium]|nr:hypothetical protein [Chlamydiota bacterium]